MKKLTVHFLILCIGITSPAFAHEYHVSKSGNDDNIGSALQPFKTISRAIQFAVAGDTISVHAGIYREWINPLRGGESNLKRIVYRAIPGDKVEIKGSETTSGWSKVKDGVWKLVLPNTFFGNYNPYKDSIFGDWFNRMGRVHHTGEMFLNGKAFLETERMQNVFNPVINPKIKDSAGSRYFWYCESDEKHTTIWANFQQVNPNKQLVEISTRPTVIYPDKPGINYITIRGFHISQAATQWAPPTAEQVGMVATHWNKGWIIENNVISDSKCSGITLGKDRSTGHNVWSADIGNINNDGNIHFIEVTFSTLRNGWNKEQVGSHIIRNNTIFNCEQTAICGSMGAAFSTIENNHIYDIWTKRQFKGAEIGGIKFHAAIDAIIRNNRIHNSARGIWLDWMTQGTRVSANLLYNNDLEDIFLEVNHGPFIIDNNILLSPQGLKNRSQGGAFLHNLITGTVHMWPDLNRFTPYHLPHVTAIKGFAVISSGDDRYYNNIFVGKTDATDEKEKYTHGLAVYKKTKLACWMSDNLYYNGAKPSENETTYRELPDHNPGIQLQEEGNEVYLHFTFDEKVNTPKGKIITTAILGKAKIPNVLFENTDGTSLKIDRDYFGVERDETNVYAGPFATLKNGKTVLKVW